MRTRGTGPHVVALARHAGALQTRAGFRAREVNDAAAADVHLPRGDLPDGHAERGILPLLKRVRVARVPALDQTRGIGETRRAHALPVRPGLGRARPVEARLARIKARRPDKSKPLRPRGQKLTLRPLGVGRVLEAVAHAPRAVVLAFAVGREARIARDVAERAGVSLTVFGVERQLVQRYRLHRVGVGVSPVPARAIRRRVVRRRLRHAVELVHVEQAAGVVIRVARDQREVIEIRAGVRLVELGKRMIPLPLHWSWHRHPEYPGKHRHVPSTWHSPMSHGRHGTEQSSPAYPNPPKTFSTLASHAHVPLTVASKTFAARVDPAYVPARSNSVAPTPSSYPTGGRHVPWPDVHAGHGIVQSAPTYPSWQMQTPRVSSGYSPLSSFTKSTAQVPLPKPPLAHGQGMVQLAPM